MHIYYGANGLQLPKLLTNRIPYLPILYFLVTSLWKIKAKFTFTYPISSQIPPYLGVYLAHMGKGGSRFGVHDELKNWKGITVKSGFLKLKNLLRRFFWGKKATWRYLECFSGEMTFFTGQGGPIPHERLMISPINLSKAIQLKHVYSGNLKLKFKGKLLKRR